MDSLPNLFDQCKLLLASFVMTLAIAGQAQTPPAAPPAPPISSPSANTPSPTVPGALRPMKDILKDAKSSPGFFTLHQKDDKV